LVKRAFDFVPNQSAVAKLRIAVGALGIGCKGFTLNTKYGARPTVDHH